MGYTPLAGPRDAASGEAKGREGSRRWLPIMVAQAKRRSSSYQRDTSWTPRGRPSGSSPKGRLIAGNPAWVQGRFMIGSPVLSRPSGAGPTVDGAIHKSIAASSIAV